MNVSTFILLYLYTFVFRFKDKAGPGQKRFFCYEATENQKKAYKSQGFPNALMNPKRQIGVNPITKFIADGCRRAGLDITGQGLRRIFVTSLANSESVNVKERLASSRHGSVAAQVPYLNQGNTSEAAKFKVLGLFDKEQDIEKDGENDL